MISGKSTLFQSELSLEKITTINDLPKLIVLLIGRIELTPRPHLKELNERVEKHRTAGIIFSPSHSISLNDKYNMTQDYFSAESGLRQAKAEDSNVISILNEIKEMGAISYDQKIALDAYKKTVSDLYTLTMLDRMRELATETKDLSRLIDILVKEINNQISHLWCESRNYPKLTNYMAPERYNYTQAVKAKLDHAIANCRDVISVLDIIKITRTITNEQREMLEAYQKEFGLDHDMQLILNKIFEWAFSIENIEKAHIPAKPRIVG
jgi:hypothetical protein